MGPACMAMPQNLGAGRVQGGGQGHCLAACLSMGRPHGAAIGWDRGPKLESRQGGSHWFGQIVSSKWNHSPVTIFHCLTTLNASRPGVRKGAQSKSKPPGGALLLSSCVTLGKCLHAPESFLL